MTKLGLSFAKYLCLGYLVFTVSTTFSCQAEEKPIESAAVRRPDPRSGDLLPVAPEQIKPGKIYNHFSPRHGRYVWAYAKKGGGFSYALGTGSTELPDNFDVVTTRRQTKELVEAEAGPWAEKSRLAAKQILVRLGADNKWQIVPARSIRSHYDIDAARRWEWHGGRRVAVLHAYGNFWHYNGNKYVPRNSYPIAEYQ